MKNLISKIEEIYSNNYYKTIGMIYDSFNERYLTRRLKLKYTNIQIFSFEIYNKIFEDIWSDFLFTKNLIKFHSETIIHNIFSFTITYNNQDYKFTFNIKYFNTKTFISSFLYYLITPNSINSNLKKYSLHSFSEYKKLVCVLYNILYNTNYDFDIVKNKFESYNTNLSKKKMRQIFNFILRFKMAGDMVQAYEARRTNTTFPSLYDNSIKILTTQDRLLSQYSMIEENINFISKFTDDGVPYLFYNLE